MGAERRCDLKDRNYLVERVRYWQEGRAYTVDIIDSSMPLQRATATLRVDPIDANRCTASMHVDMTLKLGLLGKVMEILAARGAMRRTMTGILGGLDTFATNDRKAHQGAPVAAST